MDAAQMKQLLENMERLTTQVVLMQDEIEKVEVRRLEAEKAIDEADLLAEERHSNDMAALQAQLDNALRDLQLQGGGGRDESDGSGSPVGSLGVGPTATDAIEPRGDDGLRQQVAPHIFKSVQVPPPHVSGVAKNFPESRHSMQTAGKKKGGRVLFSGVQNSRNHRRRTTRNRDRWKIKGIR